MMSADRTLALVACGLCFGTATLAADEQVPEADFLEYLGMWQESDEDWMLLEDMQASESTTDNDERSDPVPDGEESTETNDES
jgi:hypothetical protein